MEAVEQGGELTNYILISGEIVNFSQSVRVTVRCHVGEFRKEADLALPASSSFNEMITEVTDLVGAPSVSRPWRISTAGGRLVDPSAPLSATQLVDGSVVLLSPSEELPAPVIRDSAEALIASGSEQSARGIVQLWVIGALIALGAVVGFVTPTHLSGSIALAGASIAVAATVLAVWHRGLRLGWLIISAASLAAGIGVAGWPIDSARDFSLGLYATALTCALVGLGCHVLNIAHVRTTSAAVLCAVFLVIAGLSVPRSAGAVIAAAVIVLASAPGLATAVAGLRVPQLPTAGQDLSISDTPVDNVDQRSQRAHFIYEGLCLGLSMFTLPSLAHVAITSATTPVVSTLLALMLCVSLLLHAARHRQVVVLWSLMVLALAAALCAPVAVAVADYHGQVAVILWLAASIPLLAAVTSPWWAPRIHSASPTTLRWAERCEAIALVLCLPMAAHLAGLFEFIRGLG